MSVLLVALEIFLLLLRAYFSKNEDAQKSLASIKEAQSKLAALAAEYEEKLRFSGPKQNEVNRLQDWLDQESSQGKPKNNPPG